MIENVYIGYGWVVPQRHLDTGSLGKWDWDWDTIDGTFIPLGCHGSSPGRHFTQSYQLERDISVTLRGAALTWVWRASCLPAFV